MSQESNTPGPSGPPQFRPIPGKPGVDPLGKILSQASLPLGANHELQRTGSGLSLEFLENVWGFSAYVKAALVKHIGCEVKL